jgi:hypothetical protein
MFPEANACVGVVDDDEGEKEGKREKLQGGKGSFYMWEGGGDLVGVIWRSCHFHSTILIGVPIYHWLGHPNYEL